MDDWSGAIALLTEASGLAPDRTDIAIELGHVLYHVGRYPEAVAVYERVLERRPELLDCRIDLAMALREARRPKAALAQLEHVLEQRPGSTAVHDHMATCLFDLGRQAEALPHLERVAADRHDDALAQRRLATVYLALGRIDCAESTLRRVLAIDPADAETYLRLSAIVRHGPDDPDIQAMEELIARPELGQDERLLLCFALGRAHANAGRFDRAFDAYSEGNRLKRQTFDYDPNETEHRFARIAEVFRGDLPALAAPVPGQPRPLFIVGMPRSGTTLAEQILASYAGIVGVGETNYLAEAMQAAGHGGAQAYPEGVTDLGRSGLERIRRYYLDRVIERAAAGGEGRADVIVDKMPHNFVYIGLIAHLWPEAVIVVMRRDPRDVCLSCFEQLFNGHHPYAYGLEELGRYYLAYRDLMAFWRQRLPGRIIDLDYERLVDDPRQAIVPVLEALGRDWDDACLGYHENPTAVVTASMTQVRRPLYRSSVGRWRRYERQLAPLVDLLDQGSPSPVS